jgi:hypothetical protein
MPARSRPVESFRRGKVCRHRVLFHARSRHATMTGRRPSLVAPALAPSQGFPPGSPSPNQRRIGYQFVSARQVRRLKPVIASTEFDRLRFVARPYVVDHSVQGCKPALPTAFTNVPDGIRRQPRPLSRFATCQRGQNRSRRRKVRPASQGRSPSRGGHPLAGAGTAFYPNKFGGFSCDCVAGPANPNPGVN